VKSLRREIEEIVRKRFDKYMIRKCSSKDGVINFEVRDGDKRIGFYALLNTLVIMISLSNGEQAYILCRTPKLAFEKLFRLHKPSDNLKKLVEDFYEIWSRELLPNLL